LHKHPGGKICIDSLKSGRLPADARGSGQRRFDRGYLSLWVYAHKLLQLIKIPIFKKELAKTYINFA